MTATVTPQAWAAVLRHLGVPERRMTPTVELAEAILERLRAEGESGTFGHGIEGDELLQVATALVAAEVVLNDWLPPGLPWEWQ